MAHIPSFSTILHKLTLSSRFSARLLAAEPGQERVLEVDVTKFISAKVLADWLEETPLQPASSPALAVGARLRALRKRLLLALIARDVNNLATLEEVVQAISDFAELSVNHALAVVETQMIEMHGLPKSLEGRLSGSNSASLTPGAKSGFVVLAMGKMGGRELNVSSDIDLIFAYPTPNTLDEETTGPRKLAVEEFYGRLSRQVIDIISKVTADGFVFRVDMRLRPFGQGGPIASSLAMLEHYFVTHGRAWERYAWAKARAITGDIQTRQAVNELIQPFVYRRYADYALIEALRDLAERIRRDHGEVPDDVKLGRGGIREAEFTLQSLQLVQGGRVAALATQSTLALAREIKQRGLMASGDVDALVESYRFLRAVEHRIQYLDDQQTQILPSDEDSRTRLAQATNFESWSSFKAQLDLHRLEVAQQFNTLLRPVAPGEKSVITLSALLIAAPEPAKSDDVLRALQQNGIAVAEVKTELNLNEAVVSNQSALSPITLDNELANSLVALVSSSRFIRLSEGNHQRVAAMLDRTVIALQIMAVEARVVAFARIVDVIEAVLTRTAYLALLAESHEGLPRLLKRLAKSKRLANMLVSYPLLLEAAVAANPRGWRGEKPFAEDIAAQKLDDEQFLNRLREHRLHTVMQATIEQGEHANEQLATAVSITQTLTESAEAILQAAYDRLASQPEFANIAQRFAIVGYGKLGSGELGLNSDLDLVFVFDGDASADTNALIRFGSRLVNALTVNTTSGKLYEVDLRLRPDGDKGLMVTAMQALRDYLENRAWVWELQALTRARAIAGNASACAAFEQVRKQQLCRARDQEQTLIEIVSMRERMRKEHKGRGYDGNLKYVSGGLIDFEFCAQAMSLIHAPNQPTIVQEREPIKILNWLAQSGALSPEQASLIQDASAAVQVMRAHLLESEMNDIPFHVDDSTFVTERGAIQALWQSIFDSSNTEKP